MGVQIDGDALIEHVKREMEVEIDRDPRIQPLKKEIGVQIVRDADAHDRHVERNGGDCIEFVFLRRGMPTTKKKSSSSSRGQTAPKSSPIGSDLAR